MTCTAPHHQGAIKMFWLHFHGFIFYKLMTLFICVRLSDVTAVWLHLTPPPSSPDAESPENK